MARIISILLLISSQAFAFSKVVPEQEAIEYSSKKLFGPEVFEFCDGYVELWIKITRANETKLILKASPPGNTEWGISNGNIIIEDPTKADEPIRFSNLQSFKVKKGSINTHIWNFEVKSWANEYKVALLPFAGCPVGQKTRGVVLKEFKLD